MAPLNDHMNFLDQEVSTGTTIVAIKYADGVIIGADSRTSTGIYVANRITDKLTRITDHVYCCRSGSAADTQAIADAVAFHMYFKENQTGTKSKVRDVAYKFRDYCYNNRDQLMAGIIVAGYDFMEQRGKIYSIALGGMVSEEPDYTLGGSGSSYIHGLLRNAIPEGAWKTMSQEQGINHVKSALDQAMFHDGSSGGVMRIAALSSKGAERFIFTFNDKVGKYELMK